MQIDEQDLFDEEPKVEKNSIGRDSDICGAAYDGGWELHVSDSV